MATAGDCDDADKTSFPGGSELCDSLDNDCDMTVDCSDPDCSPFGPTGECCDGRDNDGDGQTDLFTCRCDSDADCTGVGSLEQVCWDTLFSVCAPRCNFLGGTLWCQSLDPSLVCNAVSGECVPR